MNTRDPYGNYTYPNKVALINGGKDYFEAALNIINKAEREIHLQTYIFDHDETGTMVGNALMAAVARGVSVLVIIDGYASQYISDEFVLNIRNAGVRFKFFEPLFKGKSFYFGRRLHHKILVADDRIALVGGVNISNKYNDFEDQKAWLDFGVIVEGPVAPLLSNLCRIVWNGFTPTKKNKPVETRFSFPDNESLSKVRMRRNDWVKNKNQISKSYIEMFRNAKEEIIILCSYFIPGNAIRRNMLRAVKRGVKIKVIMTGMSDVPVAKNAERYMYAWLLRNKIDIYEYQENILHGKVAVCDRKWVTIGSYNINDISAFASIELNLDILDDAFASTVHATLMEVIEKKSVPVSTTKQPFRLNPVRKFIAWISYQFVRMVFYLFTFYFRQDKPENQ